MWFTHTEASASTPDAASAAPDLHISDGTDALSDRGRSEAPPGTSAFARSGVRSWLTPLAAAIGLVTFAIGAFVATPSSADAHGYGHNNRCPHFYNYQHGPGGVRTTAGLNFQPDDLCNGRHVYKAYVRVYQTGPAWRCQPHSDSGWRWTQAASSPHEDSWKWVHVAGIWDSFTSGCTLKAYYNYYRY